MAQNAISEALVALIAEGASSWTVHQHRIRRVGRRGYPQRKALAQIAKRLERRAFQDFASMVTPARPLGYATVEAPERMGSVEA